MSLRDQLLKAGLVSEKEKQRVERELKAARKAAAANREAREVVERREREAREQAAAELVRKKAEERAARRSAEEVEARRHQVVQILSAYALAFQPGAQRFWHRTPEGPALHRLDLPEWVANDLRAGRLAVAVREKMGELDYVVVPREIALRVRQLQEGRLVFFNETPPDPTDPAEKLL